MSHSIVTSKRQTTTPGRDSQSRIKAGDRLDYRVVGDHATIRVHRGTRSLKGAPAKRAREFVSSESGKSSREPRVVAKAPDERRAKAPVC
jgi:hypothetical protein